MFSGAVGAVIVVGKPKLPALTKEVGVSWRTFQLDPAAEYCRAAQYLPGLTETAPPLNGRFWKLSPRPWVVLALIPSRDVPAEL